MLLASFLFSIVQQRLVLPYLLRNATKRALFPTARADMSGGGGTGGGRRGHEQPGRHVRARQRRAARRCECTGTLLRARCRATFGDNAALCGRSDADIT
eukprot:1935171-Rhodomonas_salina.2